MKHFALLFSAGNKHTVYIRPSKIPGNPRAFFAALFGSRHPWPRLWSNSGGIVRPSTGSEFLRCTTGRVHHWSRQLCSIAPPMGTKWSLFLISSLSLLGFLFICLLMSYIILAFRVSVSEPTPLHLHRPLS